MYIFLLDKNQHKKNWKFYKLQNADKRNVGIFIVCPNCHDHGYTKKLLWRNLCISDNWCSYYQKIQDRLISEGVNLHDCSLKLTYNKSKPEINELIFNYF